MRIIGWKEGRGHYTVYILSVCGEEGRGREWPFCDSTGSVGRGRGTPPPPLFPAHIRFLTTLTPLPPPLFHWLLRGPKRIFANSLANTRWPGNAPPPPPPLSLQMVCALRSAGWRGRGERGRGSEARAVASWPKFRSDNTNRLDSNLNIKFFCAFLFLKSCQEVRNLLNFSIATGKTRHIRKAWKKCFLEAFE